MSAPSILIVDDDADICANVSDILNDLGYHTAVAHDAQSALQKVREEPFDVALVDFKMPGMDGATLYSEIRRLHPEIVAIMITAYAGSDGAQRALDAGTWRVLRKPLDFSELLPLIEQAVAQPLLLVVDDDTEFCDSLWEILRDAGYRVGLAHDPQVASAYVTHRDFDIALLDLHLTDNAGGSQVFQEIGKHASTTRVLLVTGFRSEMQPTIDALMESGAKGICYKPLDVAALLRKVNELLSTHSRVMPPNPPESRAGTAAEKMVSD